MSTKITPLRFEIPKVADSLYQIQIDKEIQFYPKLHFHPEIQITLIVSGEGTVICGEYIGEFSKGDVFVFGSNLSHVFRNKRTSKEAIAISLFLDPDFFQSTLFTEETRNTFKSFYGDTQSGIVLKSPGKIFSEMELLESQSGLGQTIRILQILSYFQSRNKYYLLNSEFIGKPGQTKADNRMASVIQYTWENIEKDITLEDISGFAAMTKSSFCRYFKHHTRKTYTEYLGEVRIHQACQLLKNLNLSINDVCFESGYSNISHFNRKFKSLKGMTPSNYRKTLSHEEKATD